MIFRRLRHEIREHQAKLISKLRQIHSSAKGIAGQLSDIKGSIKNLEKQLSQRELITSISSGPTASSAIKSAASVSLNQYGFAYDAVLRSLLEQLITDETKTIVEYGSGASTRMMCDIIETKLSRSSRQKLVLLTIDHTEHWQRQTSRALPWKNYLHLRHYQLAGRCETTQDLGVSYTTAPEQLKRPLDLVYVDGRNRMQCVLFSSLLLSPDGVIILDDSKRERYQYAQHYFHEVTFHDRFTIFKRPIIKPVTPAAFQHPPETRVIVQIAFGDQAKRELDLGGPSVKNYADRIGAAYIAVDELSFQEIPSPEFAKFACYDLIQRYDRAMILDCDVVIRAHAPDIFSIVPSDHLGVVFESEHLDRSEWINQMQELFGLSPQAVNNRYFNSGVLVMGRNSYALFDNQVEEIMYRVPQYEQSYLNARAIKLGLSLYPLEVEFNYISTFDQAYTPDWRYAWFVHIAGSWLSGPVLEPKFWDATGMDGNIVSYATKELMGSRSRLVRMEYLLQSLCEEREIRVFTPTNFTHIDKNRIRSLPFAPEVISDLGNSSSDQLMLHGPHIDIEPGGYTARILASSDAKMPAQGITLEVTLGKHVVFEKKEIPLLDGMAELQFKIEPGQEKLAFQIYGSSTKKLLFRAVVLEPQSFTG